MFAIAVYENAAMKIAAQIQYYFLLIRTSWQIIFPSRSHFPQKGMSNGVRSRVIPRRTIIAACP